MMDSDKLGRFLRYRMEAIRDLKRPPMLV